MPQKTHANKKRPAAAPVSSASDFHPESLPVESLDEEQTDALIDLCDGIRQPLRDNCPPSTWCGSRWNSPSRWTSKARPKRRSGFTTRGGDWSALPLAERQRILNGWLPDPEPPTKAGLLQHLTEVSSGVVGGLELTAHSTATPAVTSAGG